jgi:serine/threonine-protein kinase
MTINKIFKFCAITLSALILFFVSALIAYQITLKGEMVSIPDLTNKSLQEAREILMDKKLFVIKSGIELHDRFDKDKIIRQDPLAGSKVKINNILKVVLSAGKEKVIVPRFVGRSLQAIGPELIEAGLMKGKISHVHTSAYAAGKIISQNPLDNEEAARGSRISFLVSQGERERKFLMPDLIGKRASVVIEKLKELEFNIGHIRYSYYPGLESGIIINQYPETGSRIQRRNLITMEVSK